MSSPVVSVCSHPLLYARGFVSEFPLPLASLPSPSWLSEQLSLSASAPLSSSDALRSAIRDLLRHGGYKPTGRGKPASEYLLRAASEGSLGSINAAVDACNVVSLHSGLPISVIDIRSGDPAAVDPRRAGGESYLFNASGQTIDLAGLLCLCDAEGPCANAVKDAQRTKTSDATTRTVSIVWGCLSYQEQTDRALGFYRDLLARLGATTTVIL
jgi:DNA/RNA-binding domain of Phe-tRNA-synthetase-like protein